MFDAELTSVIAIFAAIAALIVYINERSKRKLKTSAKPLQLKKMPGTPENTPVDAAQSGPDLQEWNFPPPSVQTPSSLVTLGTITPEPALREQSNWRTPITVSRRPHRLGTRAELREAMINMTILGPCRARAPFQDGD